MEGLALYQRIREFAGEIDWDESDEDKQQEFLEEAADLGLNLLADIGESLGVLSGRVEEEV